MTPSDLIADLRDIHTPPTAGEAAMLLSPSPIIVFLMLTAVGFYWSYRRRTNWRRDGARRLAEVKAITDPVERWTALTVLFRQIAPYAGREEAPDFLFQSREKGGPDADKRLIALIEHGLI